MGVKRVHEHKRTSLNCCSKMGSRDEVDRGPELWPCCDIRNWATTNTHPIKLHRQSHIQWTENGAPWTGLDCSQAIMQCAVYECGCENVKQIETEVVPGEKSKSDGVW